MRTFLLLSLFLSFSSLAAIQIDVDFSSVSEDFYYDGEGYSPIDLNLHNIQYLNLPNDFFNMNTWIDINSDNEFHMWGFGDGIKRFSVTAAGEIDQFTYPDSVIKSRVSHSEFKIESDNDDIYILDRFANTIRQWVGTESTWKDLRIEWDIPQGTIQTFFKFQGTWFLVVYNNSVCSTWSVGAASEKISEYSECWEHSEYYTDNENNLAHLIIQDKVEVIYNYPVHIVDRDAHGVGESKHYLSIRRENGREYVIQDTFSSVLEDSFSFNYIVQSNGILFFSTDIDNAGMFWYDVIDNHVQAIDMPKLAMEFNNCRSASGDIYCMFKMDENIVAIYKLSEGGFLLDSVFDFSLITHEIDRLEFSGAYAQTRLVNYHNRENEMYLFEVTSFDSNVLVKSKDRYGYIYPVVNYKTGINYLIGFGEDMRLARYEWDNTQDTRPLVFDDEYFEYRVMTSKSADSKNGGGSMPTYLLAMLLMLLIPRVRSYPVSGV